MAVLVAGGAGYIGAHVCKALAASGYLPVTLDDFSSGRRDAVRFGPCVEAAVSDADAVKRAVAEYSIKAVIDLAGSIEVAESVANPLKYYENNFAAKIIFLRALREAGVGAFIFSSTAAVYGEPVTIPIPETHPLSPKNPYGQSKLAVEHMLRDFHAAGGPKWTALRYFNAAGASPDGDIGECHEPETHLVPRACFAALASRPRNSLNEFRGRKDTSHMNSCHVYPGNNESYFRDMTQGLTETLEVFGDDYPTPDGTAIRDYIHVTDLAEAHVLALKALLHGGAPAIYNLGTGEGVSIREVLSCFARLGWEVPHSFKPRRPGDPVRLVADSSAARAALGWQPNHSDMETIVRSAYQWHSGA